MSQAPYITETLDWLGEGDCIVGVSSFDTRKDLPQTGGLIDPDYAAIGALHPDLVFLPEHVAPANVRPLPAVWESEPFRNTRVVHVFGFQSVDQIVANIFTIASALGLDDAAARRDVLRRQFDDKFAALSARQRINGNVAVLTNCTNSPAIIGRDSFINDALGKAGFQVTPVPKTVVVREGDMVAQLRQYWDENRIAAVILLGDKLRPNCIRSAEARQMPIYPVGSDTLYSPSPRLLDDLDRVAQAIDRETAESVGSQ
ncbi:TroA family protein [Paraburkholderia caledonica]|uniref:Iron complex transport system substrate-binding protein n=1 Tax=Paraburkholderia caledonica TaxID=134536 RepID=A0AB73IIW5_9BURK|nr:iron complex transport system substrate-binding protein [Paraburkholderia caledonica]